MSGDTITSRFLAARAPGNRRIRLSRGWHKATLAAHIISSGAWIGVDVIVAVLVITGRFGGDLALRSLAYQALAAFVVWPMLAAGLLSLATGLILGLATTWGLLRYWWVAVKLALNLVLCTLILVILQPGMHEVAGYGQDLLTASPDPAAVSNLFFPPAVSLTTLILATVLAVAKPWGRIRRRAERAGHDLRDTERRARDAR